MGRESGEGGQGARGGIEGAFIDTHNIPATSTEVKLHWKTVVGTGEVVKGGKETERKMERERGAGNIHVNTTYCKWTTEINTEWLIKTLFFVFITQYS